MKPKPISECINWEWVHAHHKLSDGKLDPVRHEPFLIRIWEHACRNGYRGSLTRSGIARVCNRNLY